MEDLWSLAVSVFQVWMFVVVFLIMLPAMFGLSLGVTGVYIQILVQILEWATVRIQRGRQQQPAVPVPLPNGESLCFMFTSCLSICTSQSRYLYLKNTERDFL
ncbi:glycerol-3-phosphate acyltransferase 3 [Plectropomus leopardus]|uniref:glycerol-3-phosphate acyltransferase 3-like n=1 Tax=Plectropomus leopardus TaxID=160734 RepID=UPI001C4B827A|nr:glycerol-3-phosphate acyltransferase 3-like [Plectropomus leopardus]XP_042364700.1 glycerol-3-phosphate acyltransferase 3 [Plectropomus leopardus]